MDPSYLYCAFCLVVRKNDLKRAVTICNGQACCFDHLYYVQGGEYNKILETIKRDEVKSEKAPQELGPETPRERFTRTGRFFGK